jgi:hypothetical protein
MPYNRKIRKEPRQRLFKILNPAKPNDANCGVETLSLHPSQTKPEMSDNKAPWPSLSEAIEVPLYCNND